MARNISNFDPVMRDLDEYLNRDEESSPVMERARCACGRFFSREVEPPAPYIVATRCPGCSRILGRSDLPGLVDRSPLLRYVEAARATHSALEPRRGET